MGMFMDGDGIPLVFSLFPGNANEQTSIKPLEEKILNEFDCQKFIYCSDAGLGSEKIRKYNHMGERAFVVTQSIKKLNAQDRQWALDTKGFKSLYDNKVVDLWLKSQRMMRLYITKMLHIHQKIYLKDLSSHIHQNMPNTKRLLEKNKLTELS